MENYNLFLDDERIPKDVTRYISDIRYIQNIWFIVRSYDQFVSIIKEEGIPKIVSFDHDLADFHYKCQNDIKYDEMEEKTGYHCARWLINYCIDNKLNLPKTVLIHSMNNVGAENIRSLFNTYNKVYGK